MDMETGRHFGLIMYRACASCSRQAMQHVSFSAQIVRGGFTGCDLMVTILGGRAMFPHFSKLKMLRKVTVGGIVAPGGPMDISSEEVYQNF